MKKLLKYIYLFFVNVKLAFLKAYANLAGDYVLNNYIEKASERNNVYALNKIGAKVESSVNLRQGLILDNTYFNYNNLSVDENAFIGRKVFFDLASEIIIKKDAVVSEGVSIMTHQDVGDRMLSKYYERKVAPVVLNEGCWIGANSTILCGVSIGKCAVVAAGSVVIRDVPDYTVVAGVPAKYVKSLKN